MNVYDQAHGLANALKESQEYKNYMELKDEVSQNAELTDMLNDFQEKQFQFQAQQLMGGEQDGSMMEQIQSLSQILMQNPMAARYLQAEFTYMRLVSEVYAILGDVVKGPGMPGQGQ